MKTSTTIKCGSVLIALFILVISSTAFIAGKSEMPYPKDPVRLVYNMAEGKSITYTSATSVTQTMDINGQTVNVLVDNNMAFKVKMIGKADDNLKLEITIDSINTKVESMQGSTGGKIKDVEDKTFIMVISPQGKSIDLNEAAKIEYTVEGGGSGNLSHFFANIFHNLPENPVKPGDTWTKNDSIIDKSSTTRTSQVFQSTTKFEGIEKINGVECAKLTSTLTGRMETTTQNQGMDIFYSGPFQGTVTLYFAVNEGYPVKQETSTKMNGTVEISGPQNMTFPIEMVTTGKIEAGK